jgi:predicted MFS family arabinose efflux permease
MSKSRLIAWTVWILASLFYAYQYILRVVPNVLIDDIMPQFGFDAATFGQFSGIYYIGYSLMHLPVGILLDRVGPKKVMSSCILLSVIGLLPLLFANYWVYPIVGRVLIGMGSSAAILGVFKVIRMGFHESQFTKMLGFSATIGLIGAIYGGGPVSYLREQFGYEAVIQMMALLGVGLAILTYFLIPKMEKKIDSSVWSNVKEVLGEKRVLATCLFAGLMVGPLEGFADVWGTAFLKTVYGFDQALSASLPSLIFVGMCFGAPILGFLGEKTQKPLPPIIGSAVLMAAIFFALCFWRFSLAPLSVCFIIVGICSAYQVLVIYLATTFVKEELAGLTSALVNMIVMVFGYVFHSSMGAVVNLSGGPTNQGALLLGLSIIPCALILGGIGFFWIYRRKKLILI